MKKLLTIIALLFAIAGKSQSCQQFSIYDVQKDTVIQGDSLYLGMKYERDLPCPYDSIAIQVFNPTLPNLPVLWRKHYTAFYLLPRYHNPKWGIIDSASKLFVTIPKDFPVGECTLYATGGVYHPTLYIKAKKANGIEEYYNKKTVKEVKYYNLIGQEVPNPVGFIIERIIYTDGDQRSIKKYYTEKK